MNDSIFRKKSIERMSSPDSLNNSIKVPSPTVWMLLLALILVLLGFFVWAIFGTLNSTVDTVVESRDSKIGCYISEKNVNEVEKGMQVVIGTDVCELGSPVSEKNTFADKLDEYTRYLGEFDDNEYVYYYTVLGEVEEGTHKAVIITEMINAVSFLWN